VGLRSLIAGALTARAALEAVRPAPGLRRTNFRGRSVTLAGGPALALGAVAGTPDLPSAVAGLGAGAVGLYDDLVGGRPEHAAKGFQGHLTALREGRVTSGVVKIAGVGASALIAAAILPKKHLADVVLGAGVIAGTANLFNLLDLRPGRALKAGLILGVPLRADGTVGAAAALLPADLGEAIMLGDAGANALGAVLGTALVKRAGTKGRLAALAALVALTAASERVSFTKVIERTPGLRELDQLGRRRA
jgi:UDP-N-acetylmuramyl pentapeptide phosphotransferase/UDP-N-acetylglucosamine-1-phosphate transferase